MGGPHNDTPRTRNGAEIAPCGDLLVTLRNKGSGRHDLTPCFHWSEHEIVAAVDGAANYGLPSDRKRQPILRVLDPVRYLEPAQLHEVHTAGKLLLLRRMIAEHHSDREPSLRLAAWVLERDYQEGRRAVFHMPTNESRIKRMWRKCRPVASLWAAAIFLGKEELKVEELAADDLPEFLAVAEDFRRFGEGLIDRRTKKPALPEGETWRVPSELALPAKDLTMPALIGPGLAALADYKVSG